MGIGHRDSAPNLSPVERPQMDPFDFPVHEDKERAQAIIADAIKEQLGLSDTLCRTCGNTSCPIEDKRATQCVEYYPINHTEDNK